MRSLLQCVFGVFLQHGTLGAQVVLLSVMPTRNQIERRNTNSTTAIARIPGTKNETAPRPTGLFAKGDALSCCHINDEGELGCIAYQITATEFS